MQKPDPGNNLSKDPAIQLFTLSGSAYKPTILLPIGIGTKESPITQQVLDVAERGRSLGVILISAQQFMSAVHPRVTGNSATKILGRTGSSEVNAPDYRFLDQDIRMAITRLAKGELLISHAIYRQPVKVIFPKPAYRQAQS